MSNPTTQPQQDSTPKADGPGALDAALDQYLTANDLQLDPEGDKPLTMVAAEAATKAANPPKTQMGGAAQTKEAPAGGFAHAPWLVEKAKNFGITDDEINSMSGADLRREVIELGRLDGASRHDSTPTSPPAASPAAPAPAVPTAPQAGASTDKPLIDWGKDADEWIDPEFRDKLQGVLGPIVKELQDTRAELAAIKGHVIQDVQQRQFNAIDSVFAKMGLAAFGTGALSEATPEQAKRRRAVVILAQEEAGKSGDLLKAIEANGRAMFGSFGPSEESPEPQNKQPQRQPQPRKEDGTFASPEQWEQATVQRPTNRGNAPEPKGTTRATRTIHELVASAAGYGANGVSVHGGDDFDLDSFPGGN